MNRNEESTNDIHWFHSNAFWILLIVNQMGWIIKRVVLIKDLIYKKNRIQSTELFLVT